MQFKIGDKVTWNSQARDAWKTKVGVVDRVVPVGQVPRGLASTGFSRKHESYVVGVETGKRVKRIKFYWPRVNALSLVAD